MQCRKSGERVGEEGYKVKVEEEDVFAKVSDVSMRSGRAGGC